MVAQLGILFLGLHELHMQDHEKWMLELCNNSLIAD